MTTVKEMREKVAALKDCVGHDKFGCEIRIKPPADCDPDGFVRLAYLYMAAISDVAHVVSSIGLDCLCGEGDLPDEFIPFIRALVAAEHNA